MSARATAWAWASIRAVCSGAGGVPIAPAARLVLLKLADRADEGGACWPGHERTAQDTGLSQFGARKAARELEQRGLIRVIRQRDRAGRSVSNRYQLAVDVIDGDGTNGVGATELPPGATELRGNGIAGGGNEVAPNLKKESKKENKKEKGTAAPRGGGDKPPTAAPQGAAAAARAAAAALLRRAARPGPGATPGGRPEHAPAPPPERLTDAQQEARAAARAAAAEKLSNLKKKMGGGK